jgi:hypothetical protein
MVLPPVEIVDLGRVNGYRIRIRKLFRCTHDIDRLAGRRIHARRPGTTMNRCSTRDESGQISLLLLRPELLPIPPRQLRRCLHRSSRDRTTPQHNPQAQRSQHHHTPMTAHHFLRFSTPDRGISIRRVAIISLSLWSRHCQAARTPSPHRPTDSRADNFRRTRPRCTACHPPNTRPEAHCIPHRP